MYEDVRIALLREFPVGGWLSSAAQLLDEHPRSQFA